MKIALIGHGKMGKMVEKMARERSHEVVAVVDSKSAFDLNGADVCIDFSHPECVLENIHKSIEQKKNVVVGTTGWYERLPEVEAMVKKHGVGLMYAPNFSIGVYLFGKILAEAAKRLSKYDVAGIEMHHNKKVDAPSGTALHLAKIAGCDFASVRCGSIPGTHTIIFASPIDTITLTHEARNREGFAEGSVVAAEWLNNKTGLFTLEEMLC